MMKLNLLLIYPKIRLPSIIKQRIKKIIAPKHPRHPSDPSRITSITNQSALHIRPITEHPMMKMIPRKIIPKSSIYIF